MTNKPNPPNAIIIKLNPKTEIAQKLLKNKDQQERSSQPSHAPEARSKNGKPKKKPNIDSMKVSK